MLPEGRLFAIGCIAVLLTAGCGGQFGKKPEPVAEPRVDRTAQQLASLTETIESLQRLINASPAQQAEIIARAKHEHELSPTPGTQLRYALLLGTPNHVGSDPSEAQRLLREVVAVPELLLPIERSLAFVELQRLNTQLSLTNDIARLQDSADRNAKDRLAQLNRRLQSEADENARLKRELAEAKKKLDALANIERSMSERAQGNEGRTP
ncbi:MAG: hypothetical protein R3E77_06390 [Steroidobacteraceae bacterium]